MFTPSRHFELTQYADETALIASSTVYHVCLGRLEWWLQKGKIATNVSKSIALLFITVVRRVRKPRTFLFLGEPTLCSKTARYLGVVLYTQLPRSAHFNQVRKKAAQRLGVLGPVLNGRCGLSVRKGVLLYKQFIRSLMGETYPI
jgi:hypothetical protein